MTRHKLLLIICAAIGCWMALLATTEFLVGNMGFGSLFALLGLGNACSVVALYRLIP